MPRTPAKCQLCKLPASPLTKYEHYNTVTHLPRIYRLCTDCLARAKRHLQLWGH